MARAGTARRRAVRRRPRRLDRERRAAVDRPRPRLLTGEPLVGRQRLHADVRRLPAARRPHGRPARPAAAVPRRSRAVLARVAGRRPLPDRGPADRLARGPGPRRRAAVARRALARHSDVQRGRRAQQGVRRLGRRGRLRRRRRRAARRHADRVGRLGVGAVGEPADRPRRGGARAAPAAREPQRRRAALRRRGRRVRDRRPVAAGLRARRRHRCRLGLRADDRAAGSVRCADRRVRGHRAHEPRAADAVPRHLPDPHDQRHQPDRAVHRDGAVLDVLLPHALHAAGARLRAARDRVRVPAAGRRDHHLGGRRVRSSRPASGSSRC